MIEIFDLSLDNAKYFANAWVVYSGNRRIRVIFSKESWFWLAYSTQYLHSSVLHNMCTAPAQESLALTFPDSDCRGRQLCPEQLWDWDSSLILAIGVSDDHMRRVIMSHDTHLCHPPRSSLAISSLGSDSWPDSVGSGASLGPRGCHGRSRSCRESENLRTSELRVIGTSNRETHAAASFCFPVVHSSMAQILGKFIFLFLFCVRSDKD